MNLKEILPILKDKYGADKRISTNYGEMTIEQFEQHPNVTDGRFGNLQVGMDEEGSLRILLDKDKTSGPLFTLKN